MGKSDEKEKKGSFIPQTTILNKKNTQKGGKETDKKKKQTDIKAKAEHPT